MTRPQQVALTQAGTHLGGSHSSEERVLGVFVGDARGPKAVPRERSGGGDGRKVGRS